EFGADPNETDQTDEAPLQSASRHGHVDCVRLLLTAGAKINHLPDPCVSFYSESAVCSAVRKGHEDVVEALISAGADLECTSKSRKYPIIAAGNCSGRLT
ncbi:MAG: ankyrin repeat domain-containing protein, partial [bacterium]